MSGDDEVWNRIAHLHAQDDSHGDAYIIANRAAATSIRYALDRALEVGRAEVELLAADGEGYTLRVTVDDGSFEDAGETWAMPYVADYAQDTRPHVVWPWQRWLRRGEDDTP